MKVEDFEGHELLGWKMLSFFSLSSEDQCVLFIETDEWFCIEKRKEHMGANYLFGCRIVAATYVPSLLDRFSFTAEARNFLRILENLPPCSEARVWSMSSLRSAREWEDVRLAAKSALQELGLFSNPPKRPIKIEELIEVDTYRLRRKPGRP